MEENENRSSIAHKNQIKNQLDEIANLKNKNLQLEKIVKNNEHINYQNLIKTC
jgi:hypothetical protein